MSATLGSRLSKVSIPLIVHATELVSVARRKSSLDRIRESQSFGGSLCRSGNVSLSQVGFLSEIGLLGLK